MALLFSTVVMITHQSDTTVSNSIITLFTTVNDDYPVGQYWPAQQISTEQGHTVNAASAFIEPDDWYSDVIQSNIELQDDRANYIGFFTDYETNKPIYLYGIQDKKLDSDDSDEDTN